ncbi:MAG: hypothetical protein JOZ49_08605 [Mycolicibacterium sp.]|nr:hypothetical protein [Mycolicibacterium sp.]
MVTLAVPGALGTIGNILFTLTTRIRFTEPVDPRLVWAKMREVTDAPAGYAWPTPGEQRPDTPVSQ